MGEEETATIKSSNQSSSSSKLASPEPRTYDTDGSSSGRSNWKSHLTDIYNVHVNCFVSAIYQSLQNGLTVYSYDVQYSMDELCSEIALEIDITSFLLVCVNSKPIHEKTYLILLIFYLPDCMLSCQKLVFFEISTSSRCKRCSCHGRCRTRTFIVFFK